MNLSVMLTCKNRPYYLQRVLESWAAAGDIHKVTRFAIALGRGSRYQEMLATINSFRPRFRCDIEIVVDSEPADRAPGMHRAIAECASYMFESDPGLDFLVFAEEDIAVSDDVLQYMRWAEMTYRNNPVVGLVLAHNRGGSGWDKYEPPQDADADQATVRLRPYFNGWVWGTWRHVWQNVIEPEWDYDCNSGGPSQSGYDWNLQLRTLPKHRLLAVVPDASRSQNIGKDEGTYSNDWSWSFSQSQSFRPTRGNVSYRQES